MLGLITGLGFRNCLGLAFELTCPPPPGLAYDKNRISPDMRVKEKLSTRVSSFRLLVPMCSLSSPASFFSVIGQWELEAGQKMAVGSSLWESLAVLSIVGGQWDQEKGLMGLKHAQLLFLFCSPPVLLSCRPSFLTASDAMPVLREHSFLTYPAGEHCCTFFP